MKYHANTKQKKARVPILTSEKLDSRTRNIIRNKERYYIMKKGSVLQEAIKFCMCMHLQNILGKNGSERSNR